MVVTCVVCAIGVATAHPLPSDDLLAEHRRRLLESRAPPPPPAEPLLHIATATLDIQLRASTQVNISTISKYLKLSLTISNYRRLSKRFRRLAPATSRLLPRRWCHRTAQARGTNICLT